MLSELAVCEHSARLFFRAPSYGAKNNGADSDSMTLALLTFGVLKQIAQRCVHMTRVCVQQRHVSLVKAVVLTGAEGGSEAWKHRWHLADLYWTSARSGCIFARAETKFERPSGRSEPVTCRSTCSFRPLMKSTWLQTPDSKRDKVSFFCCCFACLNSFSLKFLKLLDKKKQKRSNDKMKGDKCNSGRVEMSTCHVLSLFQRKILSVSLLFKQSCWFFLLILDDSSWLKGHLLGRRNVSSCLPLINHVLLDYV